MSDSNWISEIGGNWSTASNWSGGVVPGLAADVTLASSTANTVTFTTVDQVAGLISTDDLLDIQSGTLAVSGTTRLAGGLLETGGTLALGDVLNSISGGVLISTGDLSLATGATLDLGGAVTFGSTSSSYGAHIYGAGTLVSSGTVNIDENGGTGEATFGDGLKWINTGTVIQSGIVNAGYNSGIAFTIDNNAGAVFDFTTDIACLMNDGSSSSDLNNYGLLEKTGGDYYTTVYSTINSTGTIDVETGAIVIEDGGVVGGKVEGPGILQFAYGGTLSGAVSSIQSIEQTGGDLILNNVTIASGMLVDSAQMDQTGGLKLGSGGNAGLLVVQDVYDIDNNSGIAAPKGSSDIIIDSGGVFAKIGGTGSSGSNIVAAVTDNGTIVAASGVLRLSNALTGDGGVTIDNTASLRVDGAVGSGITVTLGTDSLLRLDHPSTFLGTISNFVAGDTLDVALIVTAATVGSNGTLTLRDGTVTVGTLNLAGDNTGDVFTFAKDGNGRTRIEISGAEVSAGLTPAMMGFLADTAAVSGMVLPPSWARDAGFTPQAAAVEAARDVGASSGVISFSGTHAPEAISLSLFAHSHFSATYFPGI
jgi:hypothetical protein